MYLSTFAGDDDLARVSTMVHCCLDAVEEKGEPEKGAMVRSAVTHRRCRLGLAADGGGNVLGEQHPSACVLSLAAMLGHTAGSWQHGKVHTIAHVMHAPGPRMAAFF